MKSKSQYTRTACKTFHDKTGDMLTKEHATEASMFSMQRNGTQKARSVPRIVTTIKPKKIIKKFPSKIKEGEICINSAESHFYLQMCRKIFHQEKSSTRAHLVSIARKSRTYYGSMSARNISQQCTKPWRIVWERELKGILCCV